MQSSESLLSTIKHVHGLNLLSNAFKAALDLIFMETVVKACAVTKN